MEDIGDDGRRRTGTVWTAWAHAMTAIVGTGVLALPWSIAQLGWVVGPLVLVFFAYVTYHASTLLSDCYRSPHPTGATRNHTYRHAVKAYLGKKHVMICGVAQYGIIWGTMVSYTITATMSMLEMKHTICSHTQAQNSTGCNTSNITLAMIFGATEILFSQLPTLDKISTLSYIAAAMSFLYSFIALYLSAFRPKFKRDLLGGMAGPLPPLSKVWNSFQALGNIAFAYTYAMILIEVQDTLKSPPRENKTMKRASLYSIGSTTLFYVALGYFGYAVFGEQTPGNILTGFREPVWLIDIAHLAVVVHLAAAYQVFAQPIYAFYEEQLSLKWADTWFFHKIYTLKFPYSYSYDFTPCKLALRTTFVAATTVMAILFPFFNEMVGLIGSMAFWPLTVYYPVTMHIAQSKIARWQPKWVGLQLMSFVCLLVSLVSFTGSVAHIAGRLKHASLFHIEI